MLLKIFHPAKPCPSLAAILGADTFLPPPAAVLVHPPAGPKPERDEMDVLLVIAAAALGLYCVGNARCRAYLQKMVARWGLV